MRTAKTDETNQNAGLRWAHMSFCWFCHAAAQIIVVKVNNTKFSHLIRSNLVALQSFFMIVCKLHLRISTKFSAFIKW